MAGHSYGKGTNGLHKNRIVIIAAGYDLVPERPQIDLDQQKSN